jgi:hypothetical protein
MIDVATNTGKQHTFKTKWSDFTLAEAMKFRAIDLPDLSEEGNWYEHIEKVLEVLSLFTDTDFKGKGSPTYAVYYFKQYALPMWIDLRSDLPKTYTPRMIDSFKHNGTTYYMPDNLALGDEVILQHTQTAKRFMEASNLLSVFTKMEVEGIKVMPLFVASVVTETKGEQWDEATVAKRAEQFHTLPMDTVWEVFFCTQQLYYKAAKSTLAFLLGQSEVKRKQTSKEKLRSAIGDLRLQTQALRAILTKSKR